VHSKKTTTITGSALECLPLLLKSVLNKEIYPKYRLRSGNRRHNVLSYSYAWHFWTFPSEIPEDGSPPAGSRGGTPVGGLGTKRKLFCETTHNVCIKIQQTTVVAVTG